MPPLAARDVRKLDPILGGRSEPCVLVRQGAAQFLGAQIIASIRRAIPLTPRAHLASGCILVSLGRSEMMAVILHDRVYVVLPDGAESGAIRAVSAGLRRLLRPASPPPAPPTSQASHHPADESGGGGRNVSVTINEGGGGDGADSPHRESSDGGGGGGGGGRACV